MPKSGKGFKCPECGRFTFRERDDGEYQCSRCAHVGTVRRRVKKKTGPKPRDFNPSEPVDPSKLYYLSSNLVKNNINMDLKEKYRVYLMSILKLSPYEEDLVSTLMATESLLSVRNLMFLTDIPRTKIYGTLKLLMKTGIVNLMLIDMDPKLLPEIWEYWPDYKRTRFMNAYRIGLQVYGVDTSYIEKAFERKKKAFELIVRRKRDLEIFESHLGIER